MNPNKLIKLCVFISGKEIETEIFYALAQSSDDSWARPKPGVRAAAGLSYGQRGTQLFKPSVAATQDAH